MVGLVAIGFAGGFFTHAQLTQHHLNQVAKEATIMGFEDRLFKVIGVEEEQRKRLEPIVKEYAQRMGKIHTDIHHDRKGTLDSLHHALQSELTEQQMERLGRFIHRQLRMRPDHDKKMQRRKKIDH